MQSADFSQIWGSGADYVRQHGTIATVPEEVRQWATENGRALGEKLKAATTHEDVYAVTRTGVDAVVEEGRSRFPGQGWIRALVDDAMMNVFPPLSVDPVPHLHEVKAWARERAKRMDLAHGWPKTDFEAAVAEGERLFPGFAALDFTLFIAMCEARDAAPVTQ